MIELALTGLAQRNAFPASAKRTASRHVLAAEVHFGEDAYETLRSDWRRLAALQAGTILFQTPDLLSAWARHFPSTRKRTLATIIVRHEDRIVLIWPLCIRRHGLFRVAAGAGAPIAQYDEVLIDPDYDGEPAVTAAIDVLKDHVRPDLVSLERVRADSALRAALHAAPPLFWTDGAPYTDLSEGMAGARAARKPRAARRQKKRIRRFGRQGHVGFHVSTHGEEAAAWLAEALALKHDWLRRTGRVSRAFMKPATVACLVGLARTLGRADSTPRLVVTKLLLNGKTAAIEAGFCHRDTYHLYLRAYDPGCARFGPGNVLAERVLEWCVKSGFSRYDMLPPRSRFKREWQSNEVATVDFALPITLRGRLYAALVLKRLAPAMRDAFYALPPRARGVIAGITLRMQTR